MTASQINNDEDSGNDAQTPSPEDFRILVVDNDPAHARAMTESLERVGYRCEVATTGPQGAKLIEQETFDLVITDMVMNEVDGMKILSLAPDETSRCRNCHGHRARNRSQSGRSDAGRGLHVSRKAHHAQPLAGGY